jgi:NAD(P)-dependent dehydrogenase (short-subunit alcohol dehydrogenase family)
MVTAYGGRGIAVRVDHSVPQEVEALFERVKAEQGRLDILVNDIWGGERWIEWKPFWERSLENGLRMLRQAIETHIITAYYGAPLMVAQKSGLLIEITDGDTMNYRGEVIYDLVKTSVIRLAYGMAQDLRPHGVTALAVTPGFLRSEEMLDHFGVSESNWKDATKQEPHFIASETPYFVGRAIAALAADPNVAQKSGGIYASWTLSDEYGFIDIDGNRPHWGRYFAEHVENAPEANEA